MQTRSSYERVELDEEKCFLCEEPASFACLHSDSIYDIDRKVNKCALELNDTLLPSKLEAGDMIALISWQMSCKKCTTELGKQEPHMWTKNMLIFMGLLHRRFLNGRGCCPSLQVG